MEPRVLQVLGRSAGGIARHVAQVTEQLDGDGFAVDIAGPPDLPVQMPKPLHDVSIPNGPVAGHRRAVTRLRAIVSRGRYDVVHAHGLRAGIDSALASRGGPPVLLTVHNLVHRDVAGRLKAPVYRRAEGLAVRLTDHTFAVSDDIARHLRRLSAGRDKVEVLYLGIGDPPAVSRAPSEVRRELGVAENDGLIVTASRLAPQKALHVMLDALARLERVVLAVLGTGPLESELRTRAAAAGVGDRVRWLGFRADAVDYVAAADAFCLSSVWEGVPLAAQEAILLGVPVVATAVGGMPELVEDGVTGRLVPPGDAAALAGAMERVLADRGVAQEYAAAARAHLEARFSTARMLDRLASAYRDCAI
ncbi:MAG: glycosyltransferase family 4 protein [Actinomycetota bacterium]|nr:glycosyltransferase family 4 protein [Actinomycetota bacterium]